MTTTDPTITAEPRTMRHYIGTKTLSACPMTRGEYNEYRGWTPPEDENPAAPGYLVEYDNGGKANHPLHKSYISWSPADVFEQVYKELPQAAAAVTAITSDPLESPWFLNLLPYQQRVVREKAELDTKLTALRVFVGSVAFDAVHIDERERMLRQLIAMQTYSNTLHARIKAF